MKRRACRDLLLLAAIGMLGSLALPGEPVQHIHFTLYGNYSRQWLTLNGGSLWNPGNLFALAEGDSRLFLNPEAKWNWKGLRATLSPWLLLDQQGEAGMGWREASATLAAGPVELTAGKVLLKLGTGYMFTPLGVITPARAVNDPEDSLRGQEGVEMVKADYYRENWSLSAIAFRKNDWRNLALFGYASLRGVDLYGLLYLPEHRRLEGGMALAATLGQGLEVHAEVMLHRRSPLLHHRVYTEDDPRMSYAQWPLVLPPDRVYPDLLLGLNGMVVKTSVIAEYNHRSWGLTGSAFARFRDYVAYNLEQDADPRQSIDIGSAMSVLQGGSRGMMRDYLFLRVARNLGKADLAGMIYLNMADFSLMSIVDLGFQLTAGAVFYIRPVFFSGRNDSEFGNSFHSSMLQAGFAISL